MLPVKKKIQKVARNTFTHEPANPSRPAMLRSPRLTLVRDTVHGMYPPTQKDSIPDEAVNEQVHRIQYKNGGSSGGGSPGDDIQSVGLANDPGTHDDLYARDDHVHAGPQPGDDIQSVGLANDPGTHDDLYARDDHIHADIVGGGDQEKPWDYHELTRLIANNEGQENAGINNGIPSERCTVVCEDRYYGKRTFTLWHDGGNPTNEVPLGTCFLTVEHLGIFAPGTTVNDALWQTTKWHTYTFELVFNDGTIWDEAPTYDVLKPYPGEFCIVVEPGDPNDTSFNGEPVLHIIFAAANADNPNTKRIYDAYATVDAVAPPAPHGATQLALLAECVHRTQIVEGCDTPSACYQSHLISGHGVVVVWVQVADGMGMVWSNCYDPTQVIGQRYNPALTPYAIEIVSAPDARGVNAFWPTVEANDLWTYCTYVLVNDQGDDGLYFSKNVPTGIGIGGQWTNILTVAIGPMSQAGFHAGNAPSMVILNDPDNDPPRSIIAVIIKDADVEIFGFYFSDNASDLGQACGYYLDFYPSLLTANGGNQAMTDSDFIGYQLGVSKTTLGEEEDAILYIYKTMQVETPMAVVVSPFFYMQYRNFQMISEPGPSTAWNQVMLKNNCFQINQADGPTHVFNPKVAYSNLYPVRPWKVDEHPWYPVNVFSQLSALYAVEINQGFGATPVMENVMITKDIPPYTIGQYNAP